MTNRAIARSPLSTPTLAVGIIAAAFGVLTLLPLLGMFFGFFTFFAGLAAVIIGHMAVAKSGDRRARLGLVLGYCGLAIMVGRIVVTVVRMQQF